MVLVKGIEVACAIIERDGLVLAAQRSAVMSLPLKWEFPGGKIEPGESAAACLAREIAEELAVGIVIRAPLPPSDWRYPEFAITLHPFVCALADSRPLRLLEHRAIRWLAAADLHHLDWAAADAPVLANYFRWREEKAVGHG
ncbi:MAG: (deoxy)nucleoside triphosphate pyrophosphohydrolase [Desulfuromonadales bacterium]